MDPSPAARAVDRVVDELRASILAGDPPAGGRLPPERELADTLGINRHTLRAALSRLESEGLLRARQGSGITVQDWRRTGGVALLPHLVAHGHPGLLAPFLELRRAVAAEAVAAACLRATEAELADLDAFAAALSVEQDPARLSTGNLAFARRLLELADNVPMLLLFNTVAAVYEVRPELQRVLAGNADAVRASFPVIAALVRSRDADRARTVARRALEALDAAALAHTSS